MTGEQLRSLRDAHPFVPFTIRLADGRTHHIGHRDFLLVPPVGRTAIVYHPDETFSVINILLVTELTTDIVAQPPSPATGDAA